MAELRPGLDPESSLKDAVGLFHELTSLALNQSVWTPWQSYGQPRTIRRDRGAVIERQVQVQYLSVVRPQHNDPAWPGPTYVLDKQPGSINRKLVVEQAEFAPYAWRWKRPPNPRVASFAQFTISATNQEANIPHLDPSRELTNAEKAALEPYGGGVHQVVFEQSTLPEARYRVEYTINDDTIHVDEYGPLGSFTRDYKAIKVPSGLIAVNQLLHEELPVREP